MGLFIMRFDRLPIGEKFYATDNSIVYVKLDESRYQLYSYPGLKDGPKGQIRTLDPNDVVAPLDQEKWRNWRPPAEAWVIGNFRFAAVFRDKWSPDPQRLDIWRVRNAIPGCADARPAIVLNVDKERKRLEILPLGSQERLFDPSKDLMLTRNDNERMNLYLPKGKQFSYALDPTEVPIDWLVPGRIGHVPAEMVGKIAKWLGYESRHMLPKMPRMENPPVPEMTSKPSLPITMRPSLQAVEQITANSTWNTNEGAIMNKQQMKDWVLRNCRFAQGMQSVLRPLSEEFELPNFELPTDKPYEMGRLAELPSTLDEYVKRLDIDLASLPPARVRELEIAFEKIKALKETSGPISEQEIDEETIRDITRMLRESPSEPSSPVQLHPGKRSRPEAPPKHYLGRPSEYWSKEKW